MEPNLTLTICWSAASKRFFVQMTAETTDGQSFQTAVVDDPYGCPMTRESACRVLEYAVLAMEQAYPF